MEDRSHQMKTSIEIKQDSLPTVYGMTQLGTRAELRDYLRQLNDVTTSLLDGYNDLINELYGASDFDEVNYAILRKKMLIALDILDSSSIQA